MDTPTVTELNFNISSSDLLLLEAAVASIMYEAINKLINISINS